MCPDGGGADSGVPDSGHDSGLVCPAACTADPDCGSTACGPCALTAGAVGHCAAGATP